jgi:Putative Ig domain
MGRSQKGCFAMSINVTAKSQVFISSAAFNATPELSDFTSQTWVQIGEIDNLGTWGAKGKEVTAVVLSDGYTRRLKGSIDSGTVELVTLRDPTDVGQNAAIAAATGWDTWLFKVELNDAIIDGQPNSIYYFRASVMSAENKFGTADNIIETTFNLGITGQITEVPASVAITFNPVAGALTGGTHEVAYTETIAATGGLGTVSYALDAASAPLPTGLTLNAATGVISGTPTTAGSYSFTIDATFSGFGEASAAYTLVIS